MRLYRSQIPRLAEEVIGTLALDGDIVVEMAERPEAEQDIRAIMDEYLRQEHRVVQETREIMEQRQITYDQFGRIKGQVADSKGHPTGDDGIRWIVGQILENFMISKYVEEVFGEDRTMRKTMMRLFRKHLVEEADLDREVRGRLKNMRPGSDRWDIEYRRVLDDVRRKRGLV
jgi:YD repeat-containing protein